MFTILFLNQKGGVGKTTLADELAFALERRSSTVAFVSTDPQGGSVHEVCDDPDHAESCDYQIVDTAGVLNDGMGDWCRAADVILIPMLPSTRDVEPTMRTYEIAKDSGTDATIRLVVNNFYAFGKLDKQLVEFLESEQVPVIAKVPRAVALSQAAAEGKSVAEHSPHSHVIPALEELTDSIINEKEKKYSNNSNAFMASAKKSKRQQASIQHAQPEVDELVCINVRIPKSMHTRLQYHKVETGENMTVLINRLLEAEFA